MLHRPEQNTEPKTQYPVTTAHQKTFAPSSPLPPIAREDSNVELTPPQMTLSYTNI